MNIEQRVEILTQINTLSAIEADQLLHWISQLKIDFNIALTEENGSTLITHIASMIKRTTEDEVISFMEPSILSQIIQLEVFPLAVEILESLRISFLIPEEEKDYLLLHLCTLLKKEESYG